MPVIDAIQTFNESLLDKPTIETPLNKTEMLLYRRGLWDSGIDASMSERNHQYAEVSSYTIDRGLADYQSLLPTISRAEEESGEELTVLECAELQFSENMANGVVPALALLDVGCGKGVFLIEMFEHFATKYFAGDSEEAKKYLHFSGITIADLRQVASRDKPAESTTEKIANYGINYIVGDAKFLQDNISQRDEPKYDLITSAVALGYIKPPKIQMDTIKQIYRSLKVGGVASLDAVTAIAVKLPSALNSLAPILYAQKEQMLNQIKHRLEIKSPNIKLSEDGFQVTMQNNGKPFYLPARYEYDGSGLDLLRYQYNLPPLPDNKAHDYNEAIKDISSEVLCDEGILSYKRNTTHPVNLPIEYADLLTDNILVRLHHEGFEGKVDRESIKQKVLAYFEL